jgi:SAM-dependent methyltransferase
VAANPVWYHTIELAPGVVTPGHVDLRRVAGKVLPGALAGRRALDVGTFDGFWAFELERRGAQTVALDLPRLEDAEWPALHRPRLERHAQEFGVELGRGFRLAAEALESSVRRVELAVYDLSPEAIGGPVDVVFLGALLLHLRDPVRALERVAGVLAPGGELVLLEPIDIGLTLRHPRTPVARFQAVEKSMNWWLANVAALRAWLRAAGLGSGRITGLHRPPAESRMDTWHASLRAPRRV